jgi:hypothetical protein
MYSLLGNTYLTNTNDGNIESLQSPQDVKRRVTSDEDNADCKVGNGE